MTALCIKNPRTPSPTTLDGDDNTAADVASAALSAATDAAPTPTDRAMGAAIKVV